jgi:tellurite resistance protein TerC
VKEALGWSAVWITIGLSFGAFVYQGYEHHWLGLGGRPDPVDGQINDGAGALSKYLTGYVVEKSLSVDNIFVIAMIFTAFAVPAIYQHRVLFWGVLGALVMRAAMIAAGTSLIARFHWILYLFGVFLILTGLKMLFARESHKDPNQHFAVRLARRFIPVTSCYHGQHFFVRAGSLHAHEAPVPGQATQADPAVEAIERVKPGALMVTPLFLGLLLVETTDLIFAVDSIPAIFAITGDPFLVFTSNVFAILGLRSLFFALAGLLDQFRYLKYALAAVLILVGAKMLAVEWLKKVVGEHFNFLLLAVVLGILGIGVVASWYAARREKQPRAET